MFDEKTPHLKLPLPVRGNQLKDDVGRIRESFGILDTAVAGAVQTAADAERFGEEARDTARSAAETAEDAMAEALSKATAEDLAAHNATKDAHGATPEAEPGRIPLRDEYSRIKVGGPVAAQDAANKEYVGTVLADAETAMKAHVQTEIDAIDRVPEAPKNGKAHLREDGEWVERQPLLHMGMNIVNTSGEFQYMGVKADGNNVLAVAYSTQYTPAGRSLVSTDGGRTFTLTSVTLPTSPKDLALSGASALMIAGDHVYRSTNRGAAWDSGTYILNLRPRAVAMDGNAAVIVGETTSGSATNRFMYSLDAGASWQTPTLSTTIRADSVAVSGNKAVMTDWSAAQAMYSINGGQTWVKVTLPFRCERVAMHGDMAIAVTNSVPSNRILRSMDGGATWSIVTLPVVGTLGPVDVFENIIVLSVFNVACLLYSTDYGETWKTAVLPTSGNTSVMGAGYLAVANGDSVLAFYGSNMQQQYRGFFV